MAEPNVDPGSRPAILKGVVTARRIFDALQEARIPYDKTSILGLILVARVAAENLGAKRDTLNAIWELSAELTQPEVWNLFVEAVEVAALEPKPEPERAFAWAMEKGGPR